MSSQEKQFLSYPIILSEQIRDAVNQSDSFKLECQEVDKQVDRLSQMLRTIIRLSNSTTPTPFYDPPVRRILTDVSKNLDRGLTLIRKCRRRNIFKRLITIVTAADFKKIFNILDSSIADVKWLITILDNEEVGMVLSLPPIASNDPILAWVWSFIAKIHVGNLSDKIEAANRLSSLAQDNDRNKKIIVQEYGVPHLLKLLRETTSPAAQVAGSIALFNLANDRERVRVIGGGDGLSVIVKTLSDSFIRVQVVVANLVARMAEYDPVLREEFARENVIRPLVTLLSFDLCLDDKKSIESVVKINKELDRNGLMSFSYKPGLVSSRRRERENETPELKCELKTSCAAALWMLARGSVSNSRRITETKAMLYLAMLIERERGVLQSTCLMAIMEITLAAESNADFRRAAFKTNSPAAKSVVDQLLRVIKETNSPYLQIPAIRSIGSLARTFPARQTEVIGPLVEQLSNMNQDVAKEAAVSLGKFACSDNFLCVEHSKTIIEFNGVLPIMRLLRGSEETQFYALVLLCYLAIHAENNEALEEARVLMSLEGADCTVAAAQHPKLRELLSQAIYQLNMYPQRILD